VSLAKPASLKIGSINFSSASSIIFSAINETSQALKPLRENREIKKVSTRFCFKNLINLSCTAGFARTPRIEARIFFILMHL
jgi:hypothetical protein